MATTFWDDIDVGTSSLDHSENFFAKKKLNHEKRNRPLDLNMDNCKPNKENDKNYSNQRKGKDTNDHENNGHNTNDHDTNDHDTNDHDTNNHDTNDHDTNNHDTNDHITNDLIAKLNKCEIKSDQPQSATKIVQQPTRPVTRSQTQKQPKNTECNEFKVFRYANEYAEKKKRLIAKIEAEEKEKRKFHSKRPPDFDGLHKKNFQRFLELRKEPIVPMTPNVLKNSMEKSEIRTQKVGEYLKQRYEIPIFVANQNDVVHKKPFKPKLEGLTTTLAPFDLRMSARLLERKKYDKKYEKQCEKKRKQEEESKRLRDLEVIKEMRKKTEFKAKPNPF